MSSDLRQPRHNFSPIPQVTLRFLLLLIAALGIFVYQISPLRDPSFQPNSANAGTLIPWLQGISETTWLQGAAALAMLTTINLVMVFWQWSKRRNHRIPQFLLSMFWGVAGVIILLLLNALFIGYLLMQWIVD